jgi:hypothetical protein
VYSISNNLDLKTPPARQGVFMTENKEEKRSAKKV